MLFVHTCNKIPIMSFSLFGTGSSYQARSKDPNYKPRSYEEIRAQKWMTVQTAFHTNNPPSSIHVLHDSGDPSDPASWVIRVTLEEFQSVHSAEEYDALLHRNYIRDYCTPSPSLCEWVLGFFGYNKKNV